jgi:hypothetical protein
LKCTRIASRVFWFIIKKKGVNMEQRVIGAGMIFLGSGCGAVLSSEQREYLVNAKPDEFYPLDKLLGMLKTAEEQNPKLIYAAGRRWGNAIKDIVVSKGIRDIKDAMRLVCSLYQEHHQGDVGELVLEDSGTGAVILINNGPYPTDLIAGSWEALASALGAKDIKLEESNASNQRRLSWFAEDSK